MLFTQIWIENIMFYVFKFTPESNYRCLRDDAATLWRYLVLFYDSHAVTPLALYTVSKQQNTHAHFCGPKFSSTHPQRSRVPVDYF